MSIPMVGPYPGPFDRSHYSDSLSVDSNTTRQLLTAKGRPPRIEVRPQAQRPLAALPESQPAPSYALQQQDPQAWSHWSDAYLERHSLPQEPPPPYAPMNYEPPPPPLPEEPKVTQLSSLTPAMFNWSDRRLLSVAAVSAILLLAVVVTMALYVGSGGADTRARQKRAATIATSPAGSGAGNGMRTPGVSGVSRAAASTRTSKPHGRDSQRNPAALNKHAGKKAAKRRRGTTRRRSSGKATRRALPAPSTRGKGTGKRSNREVPANPALFDVGTSSRLQRQTSPEATSAPEPGAAEVTWNASSLATDGNGMGSQDKNSSKDDDPFRTWPSSTTTTTVADETTARLQEEVQELVTSQGPQETGVNA